MSGRSTKGIQTRRAAQVPKSAGKGTTLLVSLLVLACQCETAAAQDQKKADTTAADADLLEFLGSVDSGADSQTVADDGSWIEYLAQTDIGKVAKKPDPNEAARKPEAPASEDKKND